MGYSERRIFLLMHKDIETASLSLSDDGSLQKFVLLNQEHFPIVRSDKDFRSWWERRAVPLHQKELRALLDNNTLPCLYGEKPWSFLNGWVLD